MTKEMLFLCDVYTNWCDSQNLPNFYSADDLCYGRDTKDKLTLKQKNWLETFIDVWDVVNQYTQEKFMENVPVYDLPQSPILIVGFFGILFTLVLLYFVNRAYFNSPLNRDRR